MKFCKMCGKEKWSNYKLPTDFDRHSLKFWELKARLDELKKERARCLEILNKIPVDKNFMFQWAKGSILEELGLVEEK
jgi:hypothetical protein